MEHNKYKHWQYHSNRFATQNSGFYFISIQTGDELHHDQIKLRLAGPVLSVKLANLSFGNPVHMNGNLLVNANQIFSSIIFTSPLWSFRQQLHFAC